MPIPSSSLLSTHPGFPIGYITYLSGGTVFTVRQPIHVTCLNHRTGTTGSDGTFIARPGTSTVTLTGVVSTGHGAVVPGDLMALTITIVTTDFPTTHTVPAISLQVTTPLGAPVLSDSWSAPFPFATSFVFQFL